jgi:FXSXX-COOH protein
MREVAGGQVVGDSAVGRQVAEPGATDLVDVTALPLAALLSTEDTVLSNALRRLLRELADPREAIAGWSSYQP